MNHGHVTPPAVVESPAIAAEPARSYDSETARLRVLIDFLGRPIAAIVGDDGDPDPDVATADHLAREAALKAVRKAAMGV